jgi:hypothetical protein
VFQVSGGDGFDRCSFKSDILRCDGLASHGTIDDMHDHRRRGDGAFVQSILGVQHHGVSRSEIDECFADDIEEIAIVDSHHLSPGTGGVRQWPKQVEDGRHTDGLAYRHHVLRGGMVVNREAEADAGLIEAPGLHLGSRIDIHPE